MSPVRKPTLASTVYRDLMFRRDIFKNNRHLIHTTSLEKDSSQLLVYAT